MIDPVARQGAQFLYGVGSFIIVRLICVIGSCLFFLYLFAMIASMPFILYTLPKSRTTQQLKQKEIRAAWESIKVFLTHCTNTDPLHPSTNTLEAYAPYHTDKHPDRAKKTISELKQLLGRGQTSATGVGYPDVTRWRITSDQFPKALDYLVAGQPWQAAVFGPVELLLIYDIVFVDPDSREILPNQEHHSFVMFWLGRSNKCAMNFWFPFQSASFEFWTYLKKIEAYLPFSIETKYLKRGRPNKDRTRHIFSKQLH